MLNVLARAAQCARFTALTVAVLLLGTGLTGCGVDEERVHGAGLGVIRGLAGLELDGDARFETDLGTRYIIDGEDFGSLAAFESALGGADNARGAIAFVQTRDDVDSEFSRGGVRRVEVRSTLSGPVGSTGPLRVLEQRVAIGNDTILVGIDNADVLAPGDELVVHGFTRHEDHTIFATRIERAALTTWQLAGIVSAQDGDEIRIGEQWIVTSGARARGCAQDGPLTGTAVRVRARPDAGYAPGIAVLAENVTCEPLTLAARMNGTANGSVPARFEGFIGAVGDGSTFMIGPSDHGQRVIIDSETEFANGSVATLRAGERVRVRGVWDPDTGDLHARHIRFTQSASVMPPESPGGELPGDPVSGPFRIEGPLYPADVDPDGTRLTVLGMEIRAAPGVHDRAGFFSGAVREPRDVRIRGVVIADAVFAVRIDDRGSIGNRHLQLDGPVRYVDADGGWFVLLGAEIRPDASTRLRDGTGRTVLHTTFFQLLQSGNTVRVHRDRENRQISDQVNPPDSIRLL
jgi:hypothetical protein